MGKYSQLLSSKVSVLCASLTFVFVSIYKAFDIRIVFFFGGFISLFYGLYLFLPWVAYSVCGVILMVEGQLMRGKP